MPEHSRMGSKNTKKTSSQVLKPLQAHMKKLQKQLMLDFEGKLHFFMGFIVLLCRTPNRTWWHQHQPMLALINCSSCLTDVINGALNSSNAI